MLDAVKDIIVVMTVECIAEGYEFVQDECGNEYGVSEELAPHDCLYALVQSFVKLLVVSTGVLLKGGLTCSLF